MTKKTTKTAAAAQPTKQPTRVESLHAMLSRAGGASINEIAGAFGWYSATICLRTARQSG
jgi:hypothetical protein